MFSVSNRIPPGYKKANSAETEELLLPLILFILNLSAAFDIVNQQMLLIIHADLGSLWDCLPPVVPHLSDIIEGSSPRRAVSAGFPQGPVWIHLPPPSLIRTARPCSELTELLYKTIFNQCWWEHGCFCPDDWGAWWYWRKQTVMEADSVTWLGRLSM